MDLASFLEVTLKRMSAQAIDSLPAASGRVPVLVETPQHSGLGGPFDYLSGAGARPGNLVRVPLGKREVLGLGDAPEGDDSPSAATLKAGAGSL